MIDIARPDPPLQEQIRTAIEASPYVGRRQLRFENEQGHVRLRGHVETYFQKQMAQEVVLHLDGVQGVENLLEVGKLGSSPASGDRPASRTGGPTL